jgi:hypothetical protein
MSSSSLHSHYETDRHRVVRPGRSVNDRANRARLFDTTQGLDAWSTIDAHPASVLPRPPAPTLADITFMHEELHLPGERTLATYPPFNASVRPGRHPAECYCSKRCGHPDCEREAEFGDAAMVYPVGPQRSWQTWPDGSPRCRCRDERLLRNTYR